MSSFQIVNNADTIEHTGPVFGMWFGGSSYSHGEPGKDGERFDSIEDACSQLYSRYCSGYWERQTFNYVNREPEGTLCPAVDERTEIHLSLALPPEGDFTDVYPDLCIKLSETTETDTDGDESDVIVVTIEYC